MSKIISEKNLMQSIDKVIYGALKTPEESINYFLKNLLDKIDRVSIFYPKRKLADTRSIKDRLIKSEIENCLALIEVYNTSIAEIALEWVNIAKKWQDQKVTEILTKLSENLKKEANLKFKDMREAAFNLAENLKYILDNYENLTDNEVNNLNKTRNKLLKVTTITYEKFISDLKENRLEEI